MATKHNTANHSALHRGPAHGLAFPRSEFDRRIAAVREEMKRAEADVLLVDCVEHMAYLFGYAPPAALYQAALLPLSGDPVAVIRKLDEPTFAEQSWVDDFVLFADAEDSVDLVVRTIAEHGWSQSAIAVELDSHFFPAGRFRRLEAALPDVRFVDFSRVIWELRLIKSELEIACLRDASTIADLALMAAIDTAAEGVNERECVAALYATALIAGADNGRNALVASGQRSDSLHGRLGDHRLEAGDTLHVESIPLVRGYGARIMRSTVIGAATDAQRDTAARLIELQNLQFAAMRPGAVSGDVDRILRKGVLDAGLRDEYDNFTGYTLGYIGLPKTSDFTRAFLADGTWRLEAGMAFHMYTYAGGLAFSDTILVREDGAERLTKTERQLFVR